MFGAWLFMGYMHLPDGFNSPFFMSVVWVGAGGRAGGCRDTSVHRQRGKLPEIGPLLPPCFGGTVSLVISGLHILG